MKTTPDRNNMYRRFFFVASCALGMLFLTGCQDSPAQGPGADLLTLGNVVIVVLIVLAMGLFWCIATIFGFRSWTRSFDDGSFFRGLIRNLLKPDGAFIEGLNQHFVPKKGLAKGGNNQTADVVRLFNLTGEMQKKLEELDRTRRETADRLMRLEGSHIEVTRQIRLRSDQGFATKTDGDVTSIPSGEQVQEGRGSGPNVTNAQEPATPIVPLPPPPPSIYYASIPERDGYFRNLTEKPEWNSLYRLTLLGNPATTTLAEVDVYDNREMFKTAIGSPAQYLIPVCNYDVNPHSDASGIKVKTAGLADRQSASERWKIKTKLSIVFW